VFFNTKTGTRQVWRFKLIRGICKRAGVPRYGYHTIRHFVASYLSDKKKCSLPEISKLLRHKNYQTTERYLQLVDPRLRDTMRLLEGDVGQLLAGEQVTQNQNLLTDLNRV
jgi:integrase